MGMQGGNAGLVGAQRYEFTTFEGQTKIAGLDDRGFPFTYTPGESTLLLARNGAILGPDDYTAADGASVTFNGSLRAGDRIWAWSLPAFNIADTYSRAVVDVLSNRRRNRFYDPGMRVSQENGNNAIALAAGVWAYPSDGMPTIRGGATGAATVQRVASLTPGGSGYRNRITITTANPTPAANDFLAVVIPVEGIEIADLRWGTSSAKPILCRFGFRSPIAGTFSVAIRNGANASRSWIGFVTVLPGEINTDLLRSLIVPGDQAGAWATDNSYALSLTIAILSATTGLGVQGWQSGNLYGLASGTNGMATAGLAFDLFDVGAYDVSDITNPVPPRFELKPIGDDLRDCYRYYWRMNTGSFWASSFGQNYRTLRVLYPVKMRIAGNYTGTWTTSNGFSSGNPFADAISDDFVQYRADVPTSNDWANLTNIIANARML